MSGKPGKSGRKEGSSDFRNLPPGQIAEKEARLLENRFVHRMTLADAAIRAGYVVKDRLAAKDKARQIIKRHRDPNGAFMQALNQVGVDVLPLARVIAEGLRAETAVKSGSEIKMIPDHNARHKFTETCLDILGARAPKRVQTENLTFEERLSRLTLEEER